MGAQILDMNDKPNVDVHPSPDAPDTTTSESILEEKLAALHIAEEQSTQSIKPKKLNGVLTLEGVANAIKNGELKNIIIMSGAGVSTASGIPDFRSPGTGLYDNLQKYNLPHPRAIFEIDFFKENPVPFTQLARELFPGKYVPTKAHYFVRLLAEKGLLIRNFTQNIDTLEREAKLDGKFIVEAHGSFAEACCVTCKAPFSTSDYKAQIFEDKIPKCECGGLVKPNITFFGEELPERFWTCRKSDFKDCDLLIVMGTSLQVRPFAGMINDVNDECVRLLINRDEVGKKQSGPGSFLMRMLMGTNDNGFLFDEPNNYRDVKWLGDIQDGIDQFVQLLGWGSEFAKLMIERDEYEAH